MTKAIEPNISRIALLIEYDGSDFHGWQKQRTAESVQSKLEKALSEVADQPVELICAGRTDTGVSSLGQVVHFDCIKMRPEKAWLKGANSLLGSSVSIKAVKHVDDTFHARFSALSRTYIYIIDNHSTPPAVLNKGLTWHHKSLNVDAMKEATKYFLGEQDFTSLRSSQCQSKTPNRFISELSITRNNSYVAIKVSANAFLHHMVRNIVGILLEIGDGRKSPDWAETVIKSRNRSMAGVTAKPNGLYLYHVDYPSHYQLNFTPSDSILIKQFTW